MLYAIENMSLFGQVAMAITVMAIKVAMDYIDRTERREAGRKEA